MCFYIGFDLAGQCAHQPESQSRCCFPIQVARETDPVIPYRQVDRSVGIPPQFDADLHRTFRQETHI